MGETVRTEQLGPYTYRWSRDCFPLGADSLALGEFCTLRAGDKVLDLGCGAGLLLLLCARREGELSLTGVELDPAAAALARQNLADNGLIGTILTGDLQTAALPAKVDLVVSNPPWYPQGTGKAGGPGRMEGCSLDALCQKGAEALGPKGRLALVHRPERLCDLMTSLRKAGLEPKRLQFCRHSLEGAPYALLIEAVKGGRPGLAVLPDRLERRP
jgi:tRNA1(Val) A37 N6-methylase TrmN6